MNYNIVIIPGKTFSQIQTGTYFSLNSKQQLCAEHSAQATWSFFDLLEHTPFLPFSGSLYPHIPLLSTSNTLPLVTSMLVSHPLSLKLKHFSKMYPLVMPYLQNELQFVTAWLLVHF